MGGNPWVMALALVLVTGWFSGCVDDPGQGEEGGGSQDAGQTDPADPEEPDPEELPLVEEAREVTLYLTEDRGLSPEIPAAGHVEQGDIMLAYFQGTVDPEGLSFVSDALANATLIHQETVVLSLWVEGDVPFPPFPGSDAVGGAGFFGSTLAMPLTKVEFTDPVFMPGEPVEFEVLFEFADFVPIVTPGGEAISLLPALFALTNDAAPARILVGGEHASSVTFTMSNLTRDPTEGLGAAQEESFTGLIENPEAPRPVHEFELRPETTELHVDLRLTGGPSDKDVDVDLFDAGGTHIAGGHTPATFESIYLLGPALDGLHGTTLAVEVVHFQSVNAEYEVTVSQR